MSYKMKHRLAIFAMLQKMVKTDYLGKYQVTVGVQSCLEGSAAAQVA